ncbi:hypothetical protein [Halomarina pelagica]|uniref:hypothetical protein n=1 Tax=Halomarina pelagica TaxID=2961599 RepID=UPI0020C38C09|nr:hypothetical protein [Halomarina sp. BND7]
MVDVARLRRRARLALGASLVAAVLAGGYLLATGRPVAAVGLAALLAVAGLWEYRQKVAEIGQAARRERR